jgi:hypothetical protein
MPTYERFPRLARDYDGLSGAERATLKRTVALFVSGLRAGTGRFHPSLRVHRIDTRRGLWSLTLARTCAPRSPTARRCGPVRRTSSGGVGSYAIYRER